MWVEGSEERWEVKRNEERQKKEKKEQTERDGTDSVSQGRKRRIETRKERMQ